ncbi:uncharacterized protein LOC122857623 [Aphidius gifuensis]|uniref:uncharacterized protein LOC122857623 n=1 Tax=Aphidius gifuensis TaxID=684658 RepID=UPI001CDC4E77|nr:uncharacterized protein LOC122857623 [Aphidius gifuensis]
MAQQGPEGQPGPSKGDTGDVKSPLFEPALSPEELLANQRATAIRNCLSDAYVSQQILSERLIRIYNWVINGVKEEKVFTASELSVRDSETDRIYQQYSDAHKLIQQQLLHLPREHREAEQSARSYWLNNKFLTVEEGYFETSALLKDKLSLLRPPPSATVVQNINELPPLDVPTFDGDYTTWLGFADMFDQVVIQRPGLSDISKFRHLLSALDERTKEKISGISVTGDNFSLAWEKLKKDYGNPRRLVTAELSNMLDHFKMSAPCAQELSRIISRVDHSSAALRKLGRPVDYWDDIIVYRVSKLLHNSLAASWEKKIANTTEPPSWLEFRNYLTSQERALELVEQLNTSPSPQSSLRTHHGATASPSANTYYCELCKSNSHNLVRCQKFIDMSPVARDEFVKTKRAKFICFNCLGSHAVAHCKISQTCRRCPGQRHHTMLCYKSRSKRATEPTPSSTSKPTTAPTPASTSAAAEKKVNTT